MTLTGSVTFPSFLVLLSSKVWQRTDKGNKGKGTANDTWGAYVIERGSAIMHISCFSIGGTRQYRPIRERYSRPNVVLPSS